jgi:hypothetical protein
MNIDPSARPGHAGPEGKPRITLRIRLPYCTVTAEIAAKSLRKAQTAIREAGADNIALVLQGSPYRRRPYRRGRPPGPSESSKAHDTMTSTVIHHGHGGEESVWNAEGVHTLSSRWAYDLLGDQQND